MYKYINTFGGISYGEETIYSDNHGQQIRGTTTMDLTGIMMYGIEDGDEKVLKAARVLMGISPRELASISHEFENSEEMKTAKFMAAMLAQLEGKECTCENCTKKREEAEAAKKEEVK